MTLELIFHASAAKHALPPDRRPMRKPGCPSPWTNGQILNVLETYDNSCKNKKLTHLGPEPIPVLPGTIGQPIPPEARKVLQEISLHGRPTHVAPDQATKQDQSGSTVPPQDHGPKTSTVHPLIQTGPPRGLLQLEKGSSRIEIFKITAYLNNQITSNDFFLSK